jgi:hypothetical protein
LGGVNEDKITTIGGRWVHAIVWAVRMKIKLQRWWPLGSCNCLGGVNEDKITTMVAAGFMQLFGRCE